MTRDGGGAASRAPASVQGAAPGAARGGAGVASPCIQVCRMDAASGLCEGCLRTLDEIAAWGSLDDAAKRDVLARLEARRRRPAPVR